MVQGIEGDANVSWLLRTAWQMLQTIHRHTAYRNPQLSCVQIDKSKSEFKFQKLMSYASSVFSVEMMTHKWNKCSMHGDFYIQLLGMEQESENLTFLPNGNFLGCLSSSTFLTHSRVIIDADHTQFSISESSLTRCVSAAKINTSQPSDLQPEAPGVCFLLLLIAMTTKVLTACMACPTPLLFHIYIYEPI